MTFRDPWPLHACGWLARRRPGAIAGVAAVALALAAAMAWSQDVARLGEVKITAAEINRIAARQPSLRQQILTSEQDFEISLRQLLIQRAIVAEAEAKGWDKRPEIAELIEDARNSVIGSSYLASVSPLPSDYPSDAEVNSVYELNKTHLFTPWSYHLAQIFVKRAADPSKNDMVAERAAKLARQASAANADFAAVASKESEDEASKAKGGDTGWTFEPSLLPELRGLMRQLKPGQVSAPVLAQQGWHIVKLLESRPPAPASLEDARASIVNELRVRKLAELRQGYVNAMLKKSTITIDRDAIGKLRAGLKP